MSNTTRTNPASWKRAVRRAAPAAVLAAGIAFAAGLWSTGPDARAEVPTDDPTFSDPLNFTNPFFPFEAGGMKVFRGKSEGERTNVVDLYSADTRAFMVDGTPVMTACLQEIEFEDGDLVEISYNYFATADDGTVYYFGEVVDNYEDGEIEDHDGSWLVGGPVGDDPAETDTVDEPAIFMPGDPEVGDQWKPEDVPDGPEELDTLRREDRKVRVPADKFFGCIEVGELDVADGAKERKWYAPGVGVILAKGHREKLALESSTFEAIDD